MDLIDRHCLVTGASRGIGRAVADALAARGARLTLVARSGEQLTALAATLGGAALVADLLDPTQVASLIDRAEDLNGPLDVLVNNAGIEYTKSILDTTEAELADVAQLNFTTPLQLCRIALPGMVLRGRGHIVNVSSMASAGGFPGLAVYAGTKAGLSHFTRIVRQDLKGTPVKLSAIEIGPVPTDLLANLTYEPAAKSFARFRRIQLMPNVKATKVADGVVRAIEKEKRSVWLPKRAGAFPFLVGLPQRIVEPIVRDLGGVSQP